jgi:small ligand-binding sensory domain FIST
VGTVPFAAALSQHPVAATAIGEAAGQLLEALGPGPDLVMLFVTPHHGGGLEDLGGAVRSILRPRVLLGCAAVSVLGNGFEVEAGPGVVLWGAKVGAPLIPLRLDALQGWPERVAFDPSALLLLADPFSFPAERFFNEVASMYPGVPILGGNASAAHGPGGNRLLLDDQVVTSGAVGVLMGSGIDMRAVVSQGCRPIGRPFTVTKAEHNVVFELGGAAAFTRLSEIAGSLSDEDRTLLQSGVFLGVVIDEHKFDYRRGDFLVRNLLRADRDTGALVVGDIVPVGATAQFHLRDARTADEDLRELLSEQVGGAGGALVFTCNGRGARFFDAPHHDANLVAELLGDPASAGFFAAGEFGPIGTRNFVHGHTASMALLSDTPG